MAAWGFCSVKAIILMVVSIIIIFTAEATKARHCNSHYISYKALYKLVLEDVRRNVEIARQQAEYARKIADGTTDDKYRRIEKDLDKCKRRDGEIDAELWYPVAKRPFETAVI